MTPPLRFTEADVDRAHDEWGFNCGPGALCAVLGKTPEEIRPHLGDFESKGYTNPTLMFKALRSLAGDRWTAQGNAGCGPGMYTWPSFGLARIQWGGPWTKEGVPMGARYRQTHWVASCVGRGSIGIFDVNCLNSGGWIGLEDWKTAIVPELLTGYPRADGTWWVTHSIEVQQ